MEAERLPAAFQHPPLHGVTPTRLLSLHRDATTNTICGRLCSFDLDTKSTPPFSTLSYEWGSPTYTQAITLDGHPFPILDNLYPILIILCDASEHKWLWVDSICINQQDLQERASQVQLMQRIFAQSEKTIAWLGESSPEIDEGIDFLYTLAKSHSKIMNFSTVNDTREVPADLRLPEKWRALGKFLDINWWRRMWTLQEFVIPKDPVLCCGTKQVEMFTLEAGLSAIWFCEPDSSLMRPGLWALAWSRGRLGQWHHDSGYTEHMGLIALLAYTSSSEVTNPRDRIYGLLGLVNTRDRKMIGQPDYLASVEDVYKRLVKSFIETQSSLDIICFAQTFRRAESLTTGVDPAASILPSWVPDWRVHAEPYVTPFMVSQTAGSVGNFRPLQACGGFENEFRDDKYCADGISGPKVIIDLKGGRLTCRGYHVGDIDGIGTTLKSADHLTVDQDALPITQSTSIYNIPLQSPTPAPSPPISKALLSTIVRCLTLDREDRYLTFEAPHEEFTTQFLNLLTLSLIESPETLPARCRSALSWYNFNKHLLLRGRTLEQICHDSMGREQLDDEALVGASEESFASRLIDVTSPLAMQRRLMTLVDGTLGMAPPGARKGDVVCILMGCSVPVVLRRIPDEGRYWFIGEAYVHEPMNGEFLDQDEEEQEFVLV